MRPLPAWLLALCLLTAACGEDAPATGGGGAGGGATVTGGSGGVGGEGGSPARCGSAEGALPDGLITLAWDDDVADTNLREQSFAITEGNKRYVLNEEPVHEAVRFDLDHPARIHGFSIHWGGFPDGAGPDLELTAGLYADFGHNGFDFWAAEPLWSGSRCSESIDDGGWVTYALDEPIEIAHPGLVYVAHLAQPAEPVFDFDASVIGEGTCALFADCHSALNLPEAATATYFNGISFPFQYDYLVRLHVEYTDDVAPADRIFQPVDFAPTAHASFGDYDNDGDDDLLTDGPKLWENLGDGSFADASTSSGIAGLGISGSGGVFGDFDNDGCLDVFVYAESYTAPDTLLHSGCDGTFSDATAAAGIVDVQTYEACNDAVNNVRSPTAAAAWIDIDADGFLDLFLANFICWENGNTYKDEVWHNLGDGTFESWSGANGFSILERAGRGANPADADGDGDVDLVVNNYRLQANDYYDNLGDGTVDERAVAQGLAGTEVQNYYGHTIGTAWGDLDNDGDLDLVSANLAHPRFFDFSNKTEILLQEADGTFTDIQGGWAAPVSATGLRYQETHSVPALADFDHDGNLDLIITAVYDGRPTDFYWGHGDGTFLLDAYHAGITTKNGWGVAIADIDHDGDPDAFAHVPFLNTGDPAGHWLQVRAVGNVLANRAAIGATVFVSAGDKTWMRHVQGGTGQGGQDSLSLHFGLGDASSVDQVRVVYPGNIAVTYDGPFDADQRLWVYEDGAVLPGWSNPP